MYTFTDIMTKAQMINDPTARLNFMLKENSLLPENEQLPEEEVEIRADIIGTTLETCTPIFCEDTAEELMSQIEVPENKKDRFSVALSFAKSHLSNFRLSEIRSFITIDMYNYFKLSERESKLIVEKMESMCKSEKPSVGAQIPIRSCTDQKVIPENVNNEELKDWSLYCVPSLDNGYYRINNSGITKVEEKVGNDGDVVEKIIEVCRSPFVLCGKSTPIHGNITFYKIRFATPSGDVKESWIEHTHLLTKKGITEKLVSLSINCPENNLQRETIDYISRSIAEFGSYFKTEFSSTQCGWSEDKTRFMLGDRLITEDEIIPMLPVGNPVGFNATKKRGTLNNWIGATDGVINCDIVRFKLYDAATAPLVFPLGLESHVTDTWGLTSVGKTFSSLIGISAFGSTAKNESLVLSQESTKNGVLVTVRDYSDLPILFDETTGKEEKLKDLVYQVASGISKTKSTQDGKRCGSEVYRTTLFLTGEDSLRDSLDNSGQMYRVVELNFQGEMPTYDPGYVDEVKKNIAENCGHVGELYVQKLIKKIKDGSLEKIYKDCLEALPKTASNVEGRSKVLFAGIMTAGVVIEEVFEEIGVSAKNPIELVKLYFDKCIVQNPIELEHLRALKVISDTVSSEYKNFAVCNDREVLSNDGNKRYGYVDEKYIDIFGTSLTDILKRNGFKPTKVKTEWARLKIIDPKDSNGNYRFSRFGKQENGVRIHRAKLDEMLGLSFKEGGVEDIPMNNDRINLVKTVNLLTEINGKSDVTLIEQVNYSQTEIVENLELLAKFNKIVKINETAYKSTL